MGNSNSVNAIFPPHEYDEEDEIPFDFDGNALSLSSVGTGMRVVPKITSSRSDKNNRRQLFADVKVAVLKTIRVAPIGGQEEIEKDKERLKEAASKLSRTRHPHLLRIIATYFYNSPNGLQFSIVMDYAQQNLRSHLLALFNNDGNKKNKSPPLPPRWFGCLISAIAYLHQQGIWHRDIKPETILVKDRTTILLANFDISQVGETRGTTTRPGRWKSAAAARFCSAPEVIAAAAPYSRAADIFSLGVVFLEMLLAHVEHGGGDQKMISAISDWSSSFFGVEFSPDQSIFANLQAALSSSSSSSSSYDGFSGYHNLSKSYASSVDAMGCWLTGILPPQEDNARSTSGWESDMFSTCRDMLDTEPNARSLGDELQLRWKKLTAYFSDLRCSECDSDVRSSLNTTSTTASKERTPRQAGGGDVTGTVSTIVSPVIPTPTKDGSPLPLHRAAAADDTNEITRLLGMAGVNVADIIDETDDAEQTALHYAAAGGHENAVKVLLDAKADTEIPNAEGWSALHYAARGDHGRVADVLLGNDSGNTAQIINLVDDNGWTALHFAARYGHKDVLEKLLVLASKVNVVAVTRVGQTALHLAARGGRADVVGILLGKMDEKDVNKTDLRGHNAFWYAALGNHREVMKLLVENKKVDIRTLVICHQPRQREEEEADFCYR